MKILVTGATGFTGREVLRKYRQNPQLQKHQITLFVRNSQSLEKLSWVPDRVAFGDLGQPQTLLQALQGQEALINIASLGFGHAQNIVDCACKAGVKRAIFLSTTAIFTQLNAPSKKVRTEAEQLIFQSSLDWTLLRPTMIYGNDGDRNMIRLLRFMKKYPLVPMPGKGESLLRPIHVEDLAQAIWSALESQSTFGKSYNLSGAHALSFHQMLREARSALGQKNLIVPIPLFLMKLAARGLEVLSSRPAIKVEQVLRLAENKDFDHSDAIKDFTFQTRPFRQGIEEEARSYL